MIFKNKKILLIFLAYIFVTTFLFLRQTDIKSEISSLTPFVFDRNTLFRLSESIRSDPDTNTIFVTRILHNKVLTYVETFFISLFRSLDIVFLFSLTGSPAMYDTAYIRMLYPVELPFFILAGVFFLRRWHALKKHYFYLVYSVVLAIFIAGLFLPIYNTIKILPLLITLRAVIFIGTSEFLRTSLWEKK